MELLRRAVARRHRSPSHPSSLVIRKLALSVLLLFALCIVHECIAIDTDPIPILSTVAKCRGPPERPWR
jgi:hypothetical protein